MNRIRTQALLIIAVVSLGVSLIVYIYPMAYASYHIKIEAMSGIFTGQNEVVHVQPINNNERTVVNAHNTVLKRLLLADDFNIQNATAKATVGSALMEKTHVYRNLQIRSLVENNKQKSNFTKKRIVLYHFYHGMLKRQQEKVDMSACHTYTNCDLVYQGRFTTEAIDADAVVFQGHHMPKHLPFRAFPDQVFVFLTIESPQYLQVTNIGNKLFDNFFNWTMTYRRDSDIPYLYGSVIPKYLDKKKLLERIETGHLLDFKNFKTPNETSYYNFETEKYKNYTDIFYQKTKEIIWFNSHCDTASKREHYVKYLERHVTVDIFGECSSRNNTCPKNVKGCLDDVPKTYKFYLSFENSICNDYITEKVFKWFREDIIVVVRGARKYKEYLPQGTYINSADFESPRHLAEYLSSLGSNEQEYINILKRKDQYTKISADEFVQVAYCNLCQKLNNLDKFRKIAKPLKPWWTEEICAKPKDYFPMDVDGM